MQFPFFHNTPTPEPNPDNGRGSQDDELNRPFTATPPAVQREARRLLESIGREEWKGVDKHISQLPPQKLSDVATCLENSGTPLIPMLALHHAPRQTLEAALIAGVNPDARIDSPTHSDFNTLSAIHIAAEDGNLELFQALLEHSPSLLDSVDGENRTPLQAALESTNDSTRSSILRAILAIQPDVSKSSPELWRGTDLHGLKLDSSFQGKDLSEANLIGTDLSQVTIRDGNGTNITPVEAAWYSSTTVLSPHTLPQFEGMRRAHNVWADGQRTDLTDDQLNQAYLHAISAYTYSSKCLAEARQFVDITGDVGAGLLYTETYRALLNDRQPEHIQVLDDFVRLTLSEHIQPENYRELLLKVDALMEGEDYLEQYPYLPELMLLAHDPRLNLADLREGIDISVLSQPELMELKEQEDAQKYQLEPYTLAISSIMGWKDSYAAPSTQAIHNWGRVGQISREFLRYKFDSRASADGSTPLEHFGFERIPPRSTDFRTTPSGVQHEFGPGFEFNHQLKQLSYLKNQQMQSISPDTYIEYRRAYILVSDPSHGTLVVRTSSEHFGRDRLPFVAGWSPKGLGNGFSKEDLQSLDRPAFEREFDSILDPELNVPRYRQVEGAWTARFEVGEKIDTLLSTLEGVREAYMGWRFNTDRYTAWSTLPDPDGGEIHRLTGAFRSEGFGTFTDALLEESQRHDGQLSLALVPKDHAPLYTINFEDELGFAQDSLILTPERIDALRHLAHQGWDQVAAENNGLISLFETALRKQTDIVVLYQHNT
jgi:uncharacterized protein YjbI with pentapeptide repeats